MLPGREDGATRARATVEKGPEIVEQFGPRMSERSEMLLVT